MMVVLTLAAGLWLLGWMLKIPYKGRWFLLGLLYVGVLAALVVLPQDAPLRAALGGRADYWLAVGAIAAVIAAYANLLKRVRAHVRPENRQPTVAPHDTGNDPFSENELDRYARHIVLRELGGPGQRRLKQARVLVIGAGGLGSPALQYLAAAGVGTLGVIDHDVVETANLQRQVIHSDETLGQPKVFSAQAAIRVLNPHVVVRPYHRLLTDDIAADLVAEYDIVLDGTDNFDTRYLVNHVCADAGVPLIAAAITQWEGQISLYDPARGTPCFKCIFPAPPAEGLAPACAEAGVVGPLPGVIGSMMALETIKHVTGAGQTLAGQMLIFDGLWGETRKIALRKRADCPVCGRV